MDIPKNELISVLREFNPWWLDQSIDDLPEWERSAARQIQEWIDNTKTKRSLLLTGARQVGKTTLYRQSIRRLVASGHPPQRILYATFDHPILKLAGLKRTLEAWADLYPREGDEPRYLFLDEIQYVDDWQVWLKHQADFNPGQRIAVTGSATPLHEGGTESGVGRWESIPLPTLSFGEFLQLRGIDPPALPDVRSLRELFDWSEVEFDHHAALAQPLTAHFHDYLLRGGFPEPALEDDLTRCQRLLREDIVEKVLKRDMTALYGVRNILELEKLFLYLCYSDGGTLNMSTLASELGIKKPTINSYLDLFENTHLIYRLQRHGYGKEVLRGQPKAYLADAALPGSVLLLGRKLLEQPERLGSAVETAFFKHVYTRFYRERPVFSYWRDKKNRDLEVDLIAETGASCKPFEVKYQDAKIDNKKLKGLRLFLESKDVQHGYAITQRWSDFRVIEAKSARPSEKPAGIDARILAIPAPLACYWLSEPPIRPGELEASA